MAAERRLHDDLWCGSKSSDSVISIEGNVGRPEGSSTSVSSEGISAQTSPMTSMSGQESIGDHPTWQCNTCTLLNQVKFFINNHRLFFSVEGQTDAFFQLHFFMNLSFNCHHLYCIVPSSVLRNLKLSIDDLCVRACLWTACACETVNCFLNSEELILLQPMTLICEACGTQRHKDVAKFKVWFGLVLLFLI
jgi:hypothetical protein